jgi:hypothetical protein
MTKPGLDVLTYYSLYRCAPLCPNHEPRLAGDPGKNLKRLSSCSEQTPETAIYAGKRSLVCGRAEEFWIFQNFFAWAGQDYVMVRGTAPNLPCIWILSREDESLSHKRLAGAPTGSVGPLQK